MSNPHDKLFRLVFGQPIYAAGYFRTFMPEALVQLLRVDEAELVGTSFVDEELAQREADLLFVVPRQDSGRVEAMAAGAPSRASGSAAPPGDPLEARDSEAEVEPDEAAEDEVLVYVLLEHQSVVDPMMALRLLRYVLRIWDRWLAEHPGARSVPLIVPMVLYQGARPWPARHRLVDLVASGRDETCRAFVPDFSYLLTELRLVPDDRLGPPAEATTLRFMKYVRARDMLARLQAIEAWAADLRALVELTRGLPLLASLVSYVLEAEPDLDVEALVLALRQAAGARAGDTAMSTADKLREEGRQKGLSEGLQKGLQRGLEKGKEEATLNLLQRALERRFGPVPEAIHARLGAASPEQRERWFDALLVAASLDEVFVEH